jgi:TIR domain
LARVFISYASEDRAVVERLSQALGLAGHRVWFDRELQSGAFRDQIIAQLNEAEVAIVVWSARSHASRYVIDESERAVARGILLPVRIDQSELPLGFGGLQTFDLSSWSGRADDDKLGVVLTQIERIARSPAPRAERPAITVVARSLLLAVGLAAIVAPVLALLNAIKQNLPASAVGAGDLAEGFAIVLVCAVPVLLWSGFEVRRFGLAHPLLILRRALRIYAIAALVALAIVAAAAAAGVAKELSAGAALGQLGFVVIVATLVFGALFACAKAVVRSIKALASQR